MFDSAGVLFKTFDLRLGKFSLPVEYWEAGAIVFLLFLLVMAMAQFRHHYVDWSLKGGVAGIFFGFLLALILEGFLILGGRTVLTGFLGWKNPPKPIAHALDAGREKLVQVLGINTQIPSTFAWEAENSVENALGVIQSLNPKDLKAVKTLLCLP